MPSNPIPGWLHDVLSLAALKNVAVRPAALTSGEQQQEQRVYQSIRIDGHIMWAFLKYKLFELRACAGNSRT